MILHLIFRCLTYIKRSHVNGHILIQDNGDCFFQIEECTLLVPIYNLSVAIYDKLKSKLNSGSPSTRIIPTNESIFLTIPKDTTSWANSSLSFLNQPNKIYVALMTHSAFAGSYLHNHVIMSSSWTKSGETVKIKNVKLLLNSVGRYF